MCDFNWDYEYGCIYWVIYVGCDFVELVKMKGKLVVEVCDYFFVIENVICYWVWFEFSGCDLDILLLIV